MGNVVRTTRNTHESGSGKKDVVTASIPTVSSQVPTRSRWHTVRVIVFAILAALLAGLAVIRLLGVDGNRYTAALLALTPYWTAGGLILGVLSLFWRHWLIGLGVLAITVALVVGLLPRLQLERTKRPVVSDQLLAQLIRDRLGGYMFAPPGTNGRLSD